MSEHNAKKPRTCKTCGNSATVTAKQLKEHAELCERYGPSRLNVIMDAISELERETLQMRYRIKAA